MISPRLVVRALKKSFGANPVLRGLDFELAPGEIHALVGGNGAGKSTLARILAGLACPDSGEVRLEGRVHAPASRRAAQAAGVVMVLQELSVLPTLSVAENLFLGALPSRFGVLRLAKLRQEARAALCHVGLSNMDPDTPAAALGVGRQQLVEIAAGLAQACRVLVLDEPTAALTRSEIQTLFSLLRDLRGRGASILYISHRLEEIAALADRVSVLRDGQLVATRPAAATPRERLIELMAGAAPTLSPARAAAVARGPLALRLCRLRAGSAVRDVSLDVHQGEIVGLGGLVGAGRTELLRAIFGADPIDAGELQLGPRKIPFTPRTTREAVARGFAFVPEDRKQHGIFARLALRANISAARLPVARFFPGAIDGPRESAETRRLLADLQVRHADPEQPIAELSGGNQQKIVVGRWLRREVRVWLLDEPTRGVDVLARQALHALLRARAAAGEAMLVASSDYEELATLCDRVIVLSRGEVGGEFTVGTLTPDAFLAAAFRGFAGGLVPG